MLLLFKSQSIGLHSDINFCVLAASFWPAAASVMARRGPTGAGLVWRASVPVHLLCFDAAIAGRSSGAGWPVGWRWGHGRGGVQAQALGVVAVVVPRLDQCVFSF